MQSTGVARGYLSLLLHALLTNRGLARHAIPLLSRSPLLVGPYAWKYETAPCRFLGRCRASVRKRFYEMVNVNINTTIQHRYLRKKKYIPYAASHRERCSEDRRPSRSCPARSSARNADSMPPAGTSAQRPAALRPWATESPPQRSRRPRGQSDTHKTHIKHT